MRVAAKNPGVLLVWVTSYLFFISTLVSNFSASHDSIHYLNDIASGQHLFHEHHLLYHFLANRWLTVMHIPFPSVSPHLLIESFTALWGSSALCVVWLFLRNRFFLLPSVAAAGVAVVAFSYGFWFYSVNIEVYLPPLFFVLWCLYLLSGKDFSGRDAWKIALLHSFAILFHQVNILLAPVILYAFVINKYTLKPFMQYVVTGTLLTAGTYWYTGWVIEQHHSFAEWIHWMQGYTVGHGYWQPLSLNTPLHVLTGFVHAFVGGHFIFQLPLLEHYLQNSFRSHGLNDEVFLSSRMSYLTARLLTLLFIIFSVLLLVMVFRFIRRFKSIRTRWGKVVIPLLICIATYSVFFCFWMPEILEFWILQMVLVWILIIGTLPLVSLPFKLKVKPVLYALAVLVFTLNFFGSMRWLQRLENDWYYREVSALNSGLTRQDIVIVENEWILKDFVRHFSKAQVIASDEKQYTRSDVHELVKRTVLEGHRVFIYRRPKGPAGSPGHWEPIQSY